MKIILSSHGDLAKSFKSFAELIYGQQEDWFIVGLGDNIDEFRSLWEKTLKEIQDARTKEVLIICDIPRGTPFNVAMEMAGKREYKNLDLQVITGMSTGLVLGVAEIMDDLRKGGFEHAVHELIDNSREIIKHINARIYLKENKSSFSSEEEKF